MKWIIIDRGLIHMIILRERQKALDISLLFGWFIIYSYIGWVYETILCSLQAGRFINRGFLYGPLCPIYGLSVLMMIFISERCKNVFSLFLHCALVASLMEYVISLTLENLFGMRWWNYSDKFLNIDGRICLGASVLFGVCGTIIVKFLHPLLYRFINKNITEEIARKLVKVVLVLFVCDVLISTQSYLFLGKISIE